MIRHVSDARTSIATPFSRPTNGIVHKIGYLHAQAGAYFKKKTEDVPPHSTFRNIFLKFVQPAARFLHDVKRVKFRIVLTIISFRFVLSTSYLYVFKRFSFGHFDRCNRVHTRVVPGVADLTKKTQKKPLSRVRC